MYIRRNLLYADIPTHCGKIYSFACLDVLAREINLSPVHKKVGYLLIPEDNTFWLGGRPISHKILYAEIVANVLIADIEILQTRSGHFLKDHMKDFIFRPQATFFETDHSFFSIQNFYSITAIKSNCDSFNSYSVLWSEYLTSNGYR
jgi:hypothetical protein